MERKPNQEECYDPKDQITYDIVIYSLVITVVFCPLFTFPEQLTLELSSCNKTSTNAQFSMTSANTQLSQKFSIWDKMKIFHISM